MLGLISKSQEYIKDMNIVDMGLLKLCLFSAGIILGISVPQKHKKKVAVGASVVFSATYAPVMAKYLNKLLSCKNESEDN